jgi:hypothetical protein
MILNRRRFCGPERETNKHEKLAMMGIIFCPITDKFAIEKFTSVAVYLFSRALIAQLRGPIMIANCVWAKTYHSFGQFVANTHTQNAIIIFIFTAKFDFSLIVFNHFGETGHNIYTHSYSLTFV